MLHVLNSLGSRKVVLEAELREIEQDIAANTNMCRKYGEDLFTEGTARLAQTRAEKQQKLSEIDAQLSDTNTSVRQGKHCQDRHQQSAGQRVGRIIGERGGGKGSM